VSVSASNSAQRIAFIGGGNMARSLIGGLIKTGIPKSQIAVSEPDSDLRAQLAEDFGIAVHASNIDAARDADVVVLAVKPQMMKTVCADLRGAVRSTKPLVISIAAGIRIDQLEPWLGGDIAVIRCMPNTPALIGAGAAGLCANARVTQEQRERAKNILGATGISCWIDDENLMDTVTALSGSGPAYFFLLVEALEEAAVAQGLPRDVARDLATQTCFGAGKMLRESDVSAAELRRRVTSPGGTTQAALESFNADALNAIVARAVSAATKRGGELSAQLDSP
jgi:pyrroline-5-carboxylate reductase